MLWPSGLIPDDWGTNVAIAQFRADHFIALGLFDCRNPRQVIASRLPGGRPVANIGTIRRPPLAPAEPRIARRADLTVSDLAPLDFVRG